MEDFKNMLASRTVISAIIVLIATLVNLCGYTVTPETQAEVVSLIMQMVTVVGALSAMYFRVVATKKIK